MKSTGNSFIVQFKYPQFKNYPTGKKLFLSPKLKILFFSTLLFAAASCKTCKCPAYTYTISNEPSGKTEQPGKFITTITEKKPS